MGELVVNPELCVDCGLCERNCPNNAIRVHDNVPLFCMHCSPDKAPCLAVCPKGAIQALGGAITIERICALAVDYVRMSVRLELSTSMSLARPTNVIYAKSMTASNVLKLVQLVLLQTTRAK